MITNRWRLPHGRARIWGALGSDRLNPGFDVELRRTRGTFTMVWLMFAIMWALALAVATGALVIGRKHKGLVWPALGWMAATLFVLAAFRNTAPGAPPIGCLLDYTAFLWAEAIVAVSVAYVVLRGALIELAPPPPKGDPSSPQEPGPAG